MNRSHPAIAVAAFTLAAATAQNRILSGEDYLAPPDVLAAVITSPAMHGQTLLRDPGPDGEQFLIAVRAGMPALERLARPHAYLAELAIDLRADRARNYTLGSTIGYDLYSLADGERRSIHLPDRVLVSDASWSPDGRRLAFFGHHDDHSYLYVADVAVGRARRVGKRPLLLTLASTLDWTWDSGKILVVLVPEQRGPAPGAADVAGEPLVRVSHPGETPTRTYRFLLQTPADAALLEHVVTGQLALVDVDHGTVEEVGQPAMIRSAETGPDGAYLRVTTVQKPFSYHVPLSSFGTREELWNAAGEAVQVLEDRPLRVGGRPGGDGERGGGDRRRALVWRPDGAGLSFLQREPREEPAEDSKAAGSAAPPARAARATRRGPRREQPKPATAKEEEPRKDRVMQWLPPYDDASARVVWASAEPIESVAYSRDCKRIYVTQVVDRKRRVFAVDLDRPEQRLTIVDGEDAGDDAPARGRRGGFGDRDRLLTRRGEHGGTVVRTTAAADAVFFAGVERADDPEKTAPRPYVDRVAIGTGEKTRIWQSAEDVYEELAAPLDDDLSRLVLTRQSPTAIPDSWLYERDGGALRRLTDNVDPAPEVTAARRERFAVTRVDGFRFFVEVTIPRDYGQRLPALFWFYPREYTSQKSYDESQRRHNKNAFPLVRERSMTLLTMLGYVVVEPDCPIVGEEGRMNDHYTTDLRNSLWAVIDELDERGIIDRDRLAIGGHSYGAFSTANALIHTPFFKAGIAGDGNYNRTLTPMSFQSERRHLWDARETYTRMSPLLWADELRGALLMYHGLDDANTGTFPINSPRMFQALDGLGRTAALYQYPYEGHGPRARETVLDLWARWVEWLDLHVKNPERGGELHGAAGGRDLTEGGRR